MPALQVGPRRLSSVRLAPILDAAIAVGCYLLAYRVRFSGSALDVFLPYAMRTMPIVVITQMIMLAACGVYAAPATWTAVQRILVATVGGSVAASGFVWLLHGPTGVSRAAFSADWLLFTSAIAGWRAGQSLWQQKQGADSGPVMIDRAAERPTLRGTFTSLVQHRELVRNLVLKDLKLKYRGSVLGFMWSLLNPVVMITVYAIAFTYVIRTAVPGFVFFLLLGVLAWNFFSTAATMSTTAITESGNLIRSVAFPRAILPIATVIFTLTQYVLTALVFVPAMLLLYRVAPSPPMLLYPVFLALQVLFTIGVALMLAAGTAFFRDVRHLLEIALAALFWMTPIVYPLAQVHEKLRMLILLSPVSPFIVAYQEIFFYRQWPPLTVWVVGLTYSLGFFLLGAWLFLSVEDQLLEQI